MTGADGGRGKATAEISTKQSGRNEFISVIRFPSSNEISIKQSNEKDEYSTYST